jgi:2-iminoacetate synthase
MITVVNSRNIKFAEEILNCSDPDLERHFNSAAQITNDFFGQKRTLFNPIYLSNICLADCPYCGFRVSNTEFKRKSLNIEEALAEVAFLYKRGIRNILLLAGDYRPDKYLEMLVANIQAIKAAFPDVSLSAEVATLSKIDYKKLANSGIEKIVIFQETYDRLRYNKLHQNPNYKGNYDLRYNAPERIFDAGIKNIGMGVLYGINFWKEDTLELIDHASKLKNNFPEIKLSFSFPRLLLSEGQDKSVEVQKINESQIVRAMIAVRHLFPESNLTLTGRESLQYLSKIASIATIIGFAGSTIVGGYTIAETGLRQFDMNPVQPFDIFKNILLGAGYELV